MRRELWMPDHRFAQERLIATITNNFVPCNGRFLPLLPLSPCFLRGVLELPSSRYFSTLMLTAVILLGIMMTLFISKLLSKTILKRGAILFHPRVATLPSPPDWQSYRPVHF